VISSEGILEEHIFDVNGMKRFDVDGEGADTVAVYASCLFMQGLPAQFSGITHTLTVGPIDHAYSGGRVCLDSCWFPPTNDWIWSVYENQSCTFHIARPSWDGPHCFTIFNCCQIRGDVNRSGANPDIADLVYLVSYMFQGGTEPQCLRNCDINDDEGDVPDISDLVYLVTYMFQSGPAPIPCPQQ
jgi:hypothetical protein